MKINDKEYKLELNGYTLVVYKEEFHKDLFTTIKELKVDGNFDVVSLLEIIWSFAKSSNNSVPCFTDFAKEIKDITSIITKENMKELTEIFNKSTYRSIKQKKA